MAPGICSEGGFPRGGGSWRDALVASCRSVPDKDATASEGTAPAPHRHITAVNPSVGRRMGRSMSTG